jgi:glutaredoxin
MKRMVLWFFCMVIASPGAQAGELYRWVDADGKVHYSDTPPRDVARAEKKKFAGETPTDAYLPYETRRAQQNFPVTLYVADNCGPPCDQARALLDKRGVPYSEKKLVTQEEIDAFKALSGSDSAPTLAVGRAFLKGFQSAQWQRELDVAGYPKSAPYRAPRPPAPAATPAPESAKPEEAAAPEEREPQTGEAPPEGEETQPPAE